MPTWPSPTICGSPYDQGMALAAQGDASKATELLEKAALSPDLELAIRARYNLGCLAAAKARKQFGDHPEKATAEVRKNGLADLALAVGHFRDCLHLDKDHADARQNLELIRLWIKHMESLWEQADRKQQRDEMDLPAFLQMLEEKQRALRMAVRGAGRPWTIRPNAAKPSARGRGRAQRKLGEEIGPLKEKIEATLEQSGPVGACRQRRLARAGACARGNEEGRRSTAIAGRRSRTGRFSRAVTQLHAGKLAETCRRKPKPSRN